jgi:hypothetical protein
MQGNTKNQAFLSRLIQELQKDFKEIIFDVLGSGIELGRAPPSYKKRRVTLIIRPD